MPRKIGESIPKRMSFTFTPQNRLALQESISKGEFATVAQAINNCIRFYFENQGKTPITKEWMLSNDGKQFMREIWKEIDEEK